MGRYEIRPLLGRGGMACVYRALDASLDREVALKRLSVDLGPCVRDRVQQRIVFGMAACLRCC